MMFAGPSHINERRSADNTDDLDGAVPTTPVLPMPTMPTIFDMFAKHYSTGLYS